MRIAILLLALAPMAAATAASKSSVTIHNGSSWAIHELYLSPSDEEAWGPDQLGSEIIDSDGRFTLNGIPCNEYDVRLVDEDGDECVVGGVGLCADNDTWTISDEDLLECQFGE